MIFDDLAIGAEFKIVPWRAGGNSSGRLPGTWRKTGDRDTMLNAVDVSDKNRKAFVGATVRVIPTGKGTN